MFSESGNFNIQDEQEEEVLASQNSIYPQNIPNNKHTYYNNQQYNDNGPSQIMMPNQQNVYPGNYQNHGQPQPQNQPNAKYQNCQNEISHPKQQKNQNLPVANVNNNNQATLKQTKQDGQSPIDLIFE